MGFVDAHARQPTRHQVLSRKSTHRRANGTNDTSFPQIDDGSEYSFGSAFAPDSRRYSSAAGTGDVSPAAPLSLAPEHLGIGRGREGSGSVHNRQTGLAVFPALGESQADSAPRQVFNPSSRKASAHGDRVLSGTFSERLAHTGFSPIEPGRQLRMPRLSTSSVLSTPAASFASWLPFGARQPDTELDQLRRTTYSSRNDAPVSEAGSGSSFLGTLWKNISGRPNPSSQTGATSDTDFGIEQLAIGFAEASGSLALSTSYIKPDQLGQLLKYKGTNFGAGSAVRSPPIGGGLGGWVPTSPANPSTSRTQRSIPILISSPAVLFSELALAPGESQTFSIRVQLPKALPPSFRGRVACISYDLVVVAKRSMLETSAYVVRIPFRVLAHVGSETEILSFGQPIRMPPDDIQLTFQETAPVSTPRNTSPSPVIEDSGLPGLMSDTEASDDSPLKSTEDDAVIEDLYKQLAASTFLRQCIETVEQEKDTGTTNAPSETVNGDSDAEDAVKQHLDNISRRRAPVEFSLSQSGRSVASVWLPRRAYLLGDMITGKVHLYAGNPGIYQVSIWLESVETIRDQFSNYNNERNEELTRKVYAEHHGFCRSTSTLSFSLATPPTAAASFSTDIVSNVWQLRIELIIGCPGSPASDLVLSATAPFPPNRKGALQIQSPPLTPVSPTGLTSLPATVRGRQARARSSTVAEGSAQQRIVSPPANQLLRSSLASSAYNGETQLSTSPRSVSVRRRYDAVHEVPVQTLSCTVAVQMHPPMYKELIPGHWDSYVIDLAKRA
ncbi:Golgi membrane exchange factor (Ric1p-Rgp1p) subunit [Coemansia sp. RSA 1853]|nr:Golgi membrane exchange factor (Ric1p-Rgp1p) subunit [Coemansia sp. RSA 638]KAJ2541983.1 Golgi membrane exchange factor (Ric1p-Rgp1p) subunit [Coemansia sp. RSA 1853]